MNNKNRDMKKNWIYSIALPVLFLVSCGGAEDANEVKKEAPGATPETSQTVPTYSAVEGTEVIKWTGFKLAEKVGVDGKFETFEVSGYNQEAVTISELMKEVTISMDITSVKTGDESRDGKVIKSFFGTMDESSVLKAKVLTFNEDGTATIAINMNNQIIERAMTWELYKETSLTLSGNINVPDWGAQPSLDSLNVVCEAKHKGEGDLAITWPDVDISATVNVVKK
ncbi:MAG: hypothetical protein ACI8Q1_000030 [Parvicella sp.]